MSDHEQRKNRVYVACVLAAAILFAPSIARADGPRNPSNAEMLEAEARFKEGLELYSGGNINEARVKLVEAYAVLGRTNILWNLSVAEYYSSRLLDSIRHMRVFVRSPDAEAADVALAKEKFIPAIEKQMGRVRIQAPRGTSVSVDGEELGVAPLPSDVDVMPGKHQLLAKGENGIASTVVDVRAGQLMPASLDNSMPERGVARKDGEVGRDQPRGDEPAGGRNVTVLVLAGGAVVAGVVGTVFTAMASSHDSQAKSIASSLAFDPSACADPPRPQCATLHDESHARDTDRGIGTGMFIGAGVLAVGAVASYFLWPRAGASSARGQLAPLIGRDSAGASFGGSF